MEHTDFGTVLVLSPSLRFAQTLITTIKLGKKWLSEALALLIKEDIQKC
jgi:hypothetical protein